MGLMSRNNSESRPILKLGKKDCYQKDVLYDKNADQIPLQLLKNSLAKSATTNNKLPKLQKY